VDPTPGAPGSEKTEVQLLAEIDKKFENPEAHYELARLYQRSEQWTKAEYHYDAALRFDPAHRAAQAGLVKMLVERKEPAKAEQYANGYIRQASSSIPELLRLGWEFDKLDLDEYALRSFQRALEVGPNSAEAHKQAGFYYLGKGQDAKAKQHLMRSFELNPRQPDVAGALGRLGVVVESPEAPPMTMEKQP
jgi:tetratricopeptide (TPR) repeat protein